MLATRTVAPCLHLLRRLFVSAPTRDGLVRASLRWSPVLIIAGMGIPAIALRLVDTDLSAAGSVAIFGLGILAAAMLLGGASEAAQHDIPPSLSIAVLAFVAVLPEYAVDLLFAWRAGDDPEQARFAIANMTGGNRLLLGVGWSAVLLAYIARNKFILGDPSRVLELPRTISLEVVAMGAATIVAFAIPLVGNINLIVSAVLLLIFGTYLYHAAKQPVEAPEVGGPAEMVTELPRWRRRVVIVGLFAFSAGVIVASAEPFADGLIELGESIGVDEFLLVQWLAPLASESPEFLAAMYLVWRGAARYGMTALISSKVNQFTLLIASLPIAFSISGGTLDGLPMDGRQQGEVFLTAAQSLFGVMLVLDKRMSLGAGLILLSLFLAQFALTDNTVRLAFATAYLVLAGGLLIRRYHLIPEVVREAFGASPVPESAEARLSGPGRST